MVKKSVPVLEAKDGDGQVPISASLYPPVKMPELESPDFSPRFLGIALLLVVLVVSGLWLVQRFTQLDTERDLQTWQEKLNLIAESRAADVSGWVGGNFKDLRTLAGNPSLQLYMTELQMNAADARSEPPQQNYLRNLLVFTAERAGFTHSGGAGVALIAANAQEEGKSGLAIINKQNEIVVSTLMQPAVKEALLEQARAMKAGEESLIDVQKDKDGELSIGFAVPVYGIQGEQTPEAQIGTVIGIKQVDGNLFGLLKHPGITEKTLESILLRGDKEGAEYISPLQNGASALTRVVRGEESRTSEVTLVDRVGAFISDEKDYRDKQVLATSRAIAGTPWTLVVKVDRGEALSGSNQRRAGMVTIFALILAVIALTIFAIWRYMQSHRSVMMSRHFRKLASQSMAKERLLRLVSDNQQEAIYIVDKGQVCRFANKRAADESGMSLEAMAGKSLSDVRGNARALQIAVQCDAALASGQVESDLQRFGEEGGERVIRSVYIPIEQIPVVGLPERTPGVLVVEQDISEVVHEREARMQTQSQLVKTLLNLVDKRDPFAANHSMLVSELAASVASDMELDSVTQETARISGSLMNIGKIVVPTELLTKSSRLTEEEKNIIHGSMNMAADMMNEIRFDGPVAGTLRQWQEKWDGSGPAALSGEQILISARIISVVNAYIGMISPRSWRNAMDVEAANKFLLEHCESHFDRRVVIALIHYTQTQAGRAWLKQVLESKKVA